MYLSEHCEPVQRFKTVALRPGVNPVTLNDGTYTSIILILKIEQIIHTYKILKVLFGFQ